MPHDTSLITTIVAALVLAYVFGAIANRLKMPPLVGYLIAGVAVGPHSPGFIADQTLAPQLAEIGVILLMFGVGLEFSLKDLLSVRAIAVPGALIRLALTTAVGLGLATLLDWPLLGGVVFGMALGVSSTVVTLKALQERHLVDSDRGHIALGWLVVEDLAMVLALVLIPAFAGSVGGHDVAAGAAAGAAAQAQASDPFVALAEQLLHRHLELWAVIGITLLKLLAFLGFMVVVGRRIIPFILHATAHTGSRELFRLAVLAIALGVAAGAAYLFGVSLALGAFFAGMILSESELSHRAAQETLPLRDAFGVLFFVSVGMLFDPSIIVRDPLPVIATLAIILFGKSIIGFLLLVIFRRPVAAALQVSAALAQIGEFSFILAALGVSLGVLPEQGRGLILAGAIISIVLNPAAFWLAERLRPKLETRTSRRSEPELGPVVPDHPDQIEVEETPPDEVLEEVAHPTRLSNHVVLIGYGRVGSVVASELLEEGSPFVLIEDAEGRVLAAREAGIEVIVGNAATRNALALANVMGARCVVIAIPNAFEAGQAVEQCRKLNAAVRIIARAHADEEVDYLKRLGADEVIMGEREIGLGMAGWLKDQDKSQAADAAPKLSRGENLLRQARDTQPAPRDAYEDAPMLLEPVDPVPAAATPEPVRGSPPAERRGSIFGRHEPLFPRAVPPPATIAAPAEVVALPQAAPPAPAIDEPATAESSLSLLAGGPVRRAPVELAKSAETVVPDIEEAPTALSDAPAPVEEDAAATAPELSLPAPAGAPDIAALATLEPTALQWAREPAIVDAVPVAEIAAAPEPLADSMVALEEGSSSRQTAGVRIVPASEIVILPPEPPGRESGSGMGEPAAPLFRSEFWDETDDGPDSALADGAHAAGQLRDVQQEQAAREAVEEGSWLEALERDLFGTGESDPTVEPPQPPVPQEDPVPPPEPVEPPQPQEVPVPPAQPAELPRPVEIPGPAAPPPAPGPHADGDLAVEDDVDSLGRREPRLY